ncbi:MAG: hypothetical protein AB8G11_04180 [Saprospiraceae bacterium]
MKTPSNDIFNLIQSMTKAEKRYFSQTATLHKVAHQNNYYKLFKVIENQSTYNEDLVKSEMKRQGISQHFTALKFQLTERILESLHQFYQKNSITETIKRELHFCQILMDKNHLEIANKRLTKIKNTIETYQLPEFYPEFFKIQRQILAKAVYKNIDFEGLQSLYEFMTSTIEQLQNWNEYERINAIIQKQHYEKISLQTTDFELFDDNQWLNNENIPTTFRSQILRLNSLATFNFMQGKTAKAYEYNQAFIELLETSPKMMELYGNRYISTLSNLLIDSLVLGKFDSLRDDIDKLRQVSERKIFQKKIPNLPVKIFRQTYLLELNWAISEKGFNRGIALIPTIEQELITHQKTIGIHNKITFHYLFAYCFFGNRQFSDALTYLNKILTIRTNVVTEIVEFAHLLNVLTHFELENDDLLEYLIPSTRRFLRKKRSLYKTEEVVLLHIKKVTQTIEKSKKQALWKSFKTKVSELKSDKKEQRVFNYFDFEWWILNRSGRDFKV